MGNFIWYVIDVSHNYKYLMKKTMKGALNFYFYELFFFLIYGTQLMEYYSSSVSLRFLIKKKGKFIKITKFYQILHNFFFYNFI